MCSSDLASPMNGQYGVTDIAISLPTIVGRNGIEEVLNLPMSPDEIAAFKHSSEMLRDRLANLD